MIWWQKIVIIVFVFSSLASWSGGIPQDVSRPTKMKCDVPIINAINFNHHARILDGSNRTFSFQVHSNTSVAVIYTKWKTSPLPDHVITTGPCPTLPNTTCSNLTLINVSQSDGSGPYTMIAENYCGSNSFTVRVKVVTVDYDGIHCIAKANNSKGLLATFIRNGTIQLSLKELDIQNINTLFKIYRYQLCGEGDASYMFSSAKHHDHFLQWNNITVDCEGIFNLKSPTKVYWKMISSIEGDSQKIMPEADFDETPPVQSFLSFSNGQLILIGALNLAENFLLIEPSVQYCLNQTEPLRLLISPTPNVRAVEGQTITVIATYYGNYITDDIEVLWDIKTSEKHINIRPDDKPLDGYSVTVKHCSPSTNCCMFTTSITMESVRRNYSGTELTSTAGQSFKSQYVSGHSKIILYRKPTLVDFPSSKNQNLTTGHSAQLNCTYNASSDPNITITRWSVNGTLITHNISHYTLITEYGIDQLDQVISTLIISNAVSNISGLYTCWCEYNESMIFDNKTFKSNSASVNLKVAAGTRQPQVIVGIVLLAVATLCTVIFIILVVYCTKPKAVHNNGNSAGYNEKTPLLKPSINSSAGELEHDDYRPVSADSMEHYDQSLNVVD